MSSYRWSVTLGGVDITSDTLAMDWRHGQLLPNQFGGIKNGADGTITVRNPRGRFDVASPGPGIDPSPGAEVIIRLMNWVTGPVTMFRGFSAGITNLGDERRKQTATIKLLGPLKFIRAYNDRLFTRLPNRPWSGEAVQTVLNAVEWPLDAEHSRIDRGFTRLLGANLEKQIFQDSFKRGDVIAALDAIAKLEGGSIYDNREGLIVFENRRRRSDVFQLRAQEKFTINEFHGSIVKRHDTKPPGSGVINVIQSSKDTYNDRGAVAVDFVGVTFPYTFTVEPRDVLSVQLGVDNLGDRPDETAFISNWFPMVEGTNWIQSTPGQVSLDFDPHWDRVILTWTNNSNTRATVTLNSIRGHRFSTENIGYRQFRNQASVKEYGHKEVEYNPEAIENLQEFYNYAAWSVNRHSGMIGAITPKKDFTVVKQLEVDLLAPNSIPSILDPQAAEASEKFQTLKALIASPSDNCLVSLPNLGIREASYWLEEAHHFVQPNLEWKIEMKLSDARGSVMWGKSSMTFGRYTTLGV